MQATLIVEIYASRIATTPIVAWYSKAGMTKKLQERCNYAMRHGQAVRMFTLPTSTWLEDNKHTYTCGLNNWIGG